MDVKNRHHPVLRRIVNVIGPRLRRMGIDLRALPSRQLVTQLQYHGVDTVLDVGAGVGAYGRELRQFGFGGRIVSFEPLTVSYAHLRRGAAGDPGWEVHNIALGAAEAKSLIHQAGNADSSSLLSMLPRHESAAPHARYVSSELAVVRRFDTVAPDILSVSNRPFLKLDTQGFEMQVLAGIGSYLDVIVGIQIELSLTPLYQGAVLYREALDYLLRAGFVLTDVMPGFRDPANGQLLQMDGIMFRRP